MPVLTMTSGKEIVGPTVHLNGTSRRELSAQLCKSLDCLNKTIEGLQDAAPHGRDYYTQPDGSFKRALDEYSARLAKIREVRAEILTIAESI